MNSKGDEKINQPDGEVDTLVQMTLRQAYLETTEDLRAHAEKLRELNRRRKALRGYVSALGGFKTRVVSAARERGVDLCRADENDRAELARVFEEHAHASEAGDLEYELCIPDRVPPAAVTDVDSLDDEIARWQERLNALGDDAQLANVDLQNILQKQQQALQMMSNISKMLHDTAMAVIRKMGG